MRIQQNRVEISPPPKPKRITGTRLASILELDRWKTPFETWCAITRTYEEPFKGNKYTKAGEIIEPKIVDYLKNVYGLNLITPEDKYGPNPFEKTWGNFFPDGGIFGGMWDALISDDEDNVIGVVEIKTTKRAEDWVNGPPSNYSIQACLYAHLLGVENIVMTASFLEEKDYVNPEEFEPNVDNTIIVPFKLYELYPNFDKMIEYVEEWWENHVETGVSPEYNIKKDKDIVDELTTEYVFPSDIKEIIDEAEKLQEKVDKHKDKINEDEKRLRKLKNIIKKRLQERLKGNIETVTLHGTNYNWTTSSNNRVIVDKNKMEDDGVLDKYSTIKKSYRLTVRPKEDVK